MVWRVNCQSRTRVTLELCSGTGSFSQYTKARGLTPITVDVDRAFEPTHVADVRLFDYARLHSDKRHLKYIWCSPLCTHYSNAKRSGTRDYAEADSIVQRCLDIIGYCDCELRFIENPPAGYLKSRPCMKDRPYHAAGYCAYEDTGRKKSTAIWTNHATWGLPLFAMAKEEHKVACLYWIREANASCKRVHLHSR